MPDYTKNYLLPLPYPTDYYDIHVVNGITAFLDEKLGELGPEEDLVTIPHGLGCYPMPLVGWAKYALGIGGLGEGPMGGLDTRQCPAKARYLDSGSLVLIVPKNVAGLGIGPTLHRINNREYTVTWSSNQTDSLYVRLI